MFDLSRNDLKKFIILLFLIILSCNPFYSASKKSKKKSQNEKTQTEITIEATFQKDELEQTGDETVEEMIKLPVQKRTFFYKIDEQIIKNVENFFGCKPSFYAVCKTSQKVFNIFQQSSFQHFNTRFCLKICFLFNYHPILWIFYWQR